MEKKDAQFAKVVSESVNPCVTDGAFEEWQRRALAMIAVVACDTEMLPDRKFDNILTIIRAERGMWRARSKAYRTLDLVSDDLYQHIHK